jgi:hypothetical protein
VSRRGGRCPVSCSYNDDPFVGVGISYSVWTSTEQDASNVWSAETYQGWANGYPKTATAMVWPVRAR